MVKRRELKFGLVIVISNVPFKRTTRATTHRMTAALLQAGVYSTHSSHTVWSNGPFIRSFIGPFVHSLVHSHPTVIFTPPQLAACLKPLSPPTNVSKSHCITLYTPRASEYDVSDRGRFGHPSIYAHTHLVIRPFARIYTTRASV